MRPIGPSDHPAVLRLNQAHEAETSALTAAALADLAASAFLALVSADRASAFLIALDQRAGYASPNFLWFRDRFDRFVYVDRVIVASAARGQGWGRRLYSAVFDAAAASGHCRVVCEVNIEPPNPGSDAFHAALGFVEVGRASIHGGAKTVRYLLRELPPPPAAVQDR